VIEILSWRVIGRKTGWPLFLIAHPAKDFNPGSGLGQAFGGICSEFSD
jgi:hypothetical protein